MEAVGSSTSAVRNKREDWLSPSKTSIVVKVVAFFAIACVVSVAVIVSIPLIKKNQAAKHVALQSTFHNTVKNETYGKNQEYF